jgi:hypothetical protein
VVQVWYLFVAGAACDLTQPGVRVRVVSFGYSGGGEKLRAPYPMLLKERFAPVDQPQGQNSRCRL